ncbi:MAG: AAA family ATPase [Lachnospiraceae bacterium]|nr:AAA family ATPase [Lachnospiraceae bacterium]
MSIGAQDFVDLREKKCFYIDKTGFLTEWWKSMDSVTLITRPRRFGKTLNMRTAEAFFSMKYAGRGEELFGDLDVWQDVEMRKEQGAWPVIFLTFAGIKQNNYEDAVKAIKRSLSQLMAQHSSLTGVAKSASEEIAESMSDVEAELALNRLSELLEDHYGKKALIFLDEYDTPMQEAWVNGYWDEMVSFTRSLFNNTFKTNPSLGRGIMTGITRVSKESIFSDLNNLTVITTTTNEYSTAFGFTEDEVFAAMDEQGFDPALREKVKAVYDGFTFGNETDIYNPWSITNFLKFREFKPYWADSSSNSLAGSLIRTGDPKLKETFEYLLKGESIEAEIDEQVVFSNLDGSENAVWSLLFASGYLKAVSIRNISDDPLGADKLLYTLTLTNKEVRIMFESLISRWFSGTASLSAFVKCMLTGNVKDMNRYMNDIALKTFSSFDTGVKPSEHKEPERFYHGFVLGLMVEKAGDYVLTSNRESGYGRYDVVMEPKDKNAVAVIMEFKVMDEEDGEKDLSDTAANALKQIEEKKYDTDLLSRGIPAEHIYKYGFAFRGSECLILMAQPS